MIHAKREEDGALVIMGEAPQNCDKCGKPVAPDNDAVMLDLIRGGGLSLVVAQPRHLLPEGDCPGSPSRAQYLEGQPRDERYAYNEDIEQSIRDAYVKLKEER